MVAPGVWTVEEPASPHGSRRTYAAVPVAVVGAMRPVLTYGANFHEAHTGYRQKALVVAGKRR
jgi:ribosomal protein S4E